MSDQCVLNVLVRVLDTLLAPGAKISDNNVNRLVKYVTGMPGNTLSFLVIWTTESFVKINTYKLAFNLSGVIVQLQNLQKPTFVKNILFSLDLCQTLKKR